MNVPPELDTLRDWLRFAVSRFTHAGLAFGHGCANAYDEAAYLLLHALHLPHDLSPAYGPARLTAAEKERVLALIERRIDEHQPVAYLTGSAWFAGLKFKSDTRALVPRSPIAEMIQSGFSPWLEDRLTHLHSTRTQIFTRFFPRCGIPDHLAGWDEYAEFVRFLISTKSIREHTEIWWSVRPHQAFPTVEVRI